MKKEYNSLANDYNKIIDLDYMICPLCGEWKSTQNNFYHSNRTKTGLLHCGCKQCLYESATIEIDKKTHERIDDRDKAIETLRLMDLPFIEETYQAQVNLIQEQTGQKRNTAWSQYITMLLSLPNWKGLVFKDSQFSVDDLDNNTEENTRIIQKTIKAAKKRFGSNYSNEELMFLEEDYQDWITRYECNSKAGEEIFENLAIGKLLKRKALARGESTDKIDQSIQKWLDAGKLQPKQNSSNAFNDTLTFGQMIEKWEEEKPVPEPEGDFRDIDKIGLYLDVFFKGHLSKMMGLKNAFSSLYEKYMSKYIVTKPQYDEDTDSEELFNQIFGSKIDEEE